MTKHQTLIKHLSEELAVSKAPPTMLDVLHGAIEKNADIDTVERLVALYERSEAERKKSVFAEALARVQSKVPSIDKNGVQKNKDGTIRNRYSTYQDIDRELRPLLTEEGFSISFDNGSTDAAVFTVTGTLRHREGYAEDRSFVVPIDTNKFRSPIQDVASSNAVAKRHIVKNWFNIVEDGDDLPFDSQPISADQALDLRSVIESSGRDEKRFCYLMGIAKIEDLPARDLDKALRMAEVKKDH